MVHTKPVTVPNPIPGVVYYKKFPEWVRHKYLQVLDHTCQLCHKRMLYKDMHVHRIRRKEYYTLCKLDHKEQNCMFVHEKCHLRLHENELGHGSHSY